MQTHRVGGVAAVLVGILAVGPFALLACEDSSTGNGGTPSTPTATGTNTTPVPTAPIAISDAAVDADAEADAGVVDPDPDARTVKLVNLSAEPAINACFRKDGTTDAFVGPIYRTGGIPIGGVSARVIITLPGNGGGNGEFKIIAEGASCQAAGLASLTLNLATQSQKSRLGLYYLPGGGTTAGVFVEHLTPTAGKDSVLTQPPYTNATLTRDDGVGTPINLRGPASVPVLVDPDLVGKVSATGVTAPDRPIKTVAGGTLSIWSTPTLFIFCDERAPEVDGLTSCPTTLRAP